MNSRQKGKRGELELVAALRDLGVPARRGQQFHGGPESPDVVCELPGFHFECKRSERFSAYDAMEQASSEAPTGATPVVCHKRNRGEWLAVVRLEDFVRLARMEAGK